MAQWAKLTALIFITDVALGLAVRVIVTTGAAAVEAASRPAAPRLELVTTRELVDELAARAH
jgi:hypothetical protein